jgi:hypothetical protein
LAANVAKLDASIKCEMNAGGADPRPEAFEITAGGKVLYSKLATELFPKAEDVVAVAKRFRESPAEFPDNK